MKQRRVEKVSASASKVFLLKAEEFLATAEGEASRERWNAAGLSAVHAGISSADAVLAAQCGLRSREPDHSAVLALLRERVGDFVAPQERQLQGLLRAKNMVEYEDRLITREEAVQMVESARRLVRWAAGLVSKVKSDPREWRGILAGEDTDPGREKTDRSF